VVPVHPHLTLAHAPHVQRHRRAPRRRVEQGFVPCQWLLATGTGPLDGGAAGDGVEPQRLAFQADLRRPDSDSVSELGLNKGENAFNF
jgi:hypothetical protein